MFFVSSTHTSIINRDDFSIRLRSTTPREMSALENVMIKWFKEIIPAVNRFGTKFLRIVS